MIKATLPRARENEQRLRPRLLEADAGNGLLARLGRGHAQSIGQAMEEPVNHVRATFRSKTHGARTSTPVIDSTKSKIKRP